jgi:signal transduction histidine kinase
MNESVCFLVWTGHDHRVALLLETLRRAGWQPCPRRLASLAHLRTTLDAESGPGRSCFLAIDETASLEALAAVVADARQADLPVVVLCRPDREQAGLDALAAGVDDYLLEDRPARLAALVRRWRAGSVSDRRAFEQALCDRDELERRVRERTQQLGAANKELEAFCYSVSHDLRAPLRSIDGFSKALLEDCADRLDDDGRDALRRVRRASQRMGELIDDLLMLSRVTRSEMHRMPVSLTDLARTIAAGLHDLAPRRVVEWIIADDLHASADPALLRVVLENLLSNAWKYTSRHERSRIELGCNGKKAFFVRDDGAGFDPVYAGKLFQPFQRLHRPDEFEGHGIGLATVQRIVHRHGGRVWASGQIEQGATFYFTL